MAVNVTVKTIGSGYNLSDINANFQALKTAMLNAVGRSGDTPNSMDADLDLNSNDILNGGTISTQSLFVNGINVNNIVGQPGPQGPQGDAGTMVGIVAGTNIVVDDGVPATPTVSTSAAVLTNSSTHTLTNKTFNTAGAGNSFSINNVAVTDNTGSGKMVRQYNADLIQPTVDGTFGVTYNGLFSGGTIVRANNTASGILTLPATTDTLIGKATTDTLTNKTFDTAGTGNSFSINGVAVTTNTGTGSIVRSNNAFLVQPSVDGTFGLTYNGATSGTALVKAAAVSGSTILTLPIGTDTLIARATTDTLTNKTFDTAGTGNSFSINGVAANSNTGTGAVVRDTSPTLVTPVLGVATATNVTISGYPGSDTTSTAGYRGTSGYAIVAFSTYGTSTATRTHSRFENPNGVVGSISTNGTATAYNTSSDKRLKTNLRDFDSGSIIDNIKTYHFDWHKGGDGYGVMAQDLYTVFPQAVTVGGDQDDINARDFNPWSVDYSKLVPFLIHEVQELRARITALEAK